MCIRTIYHFIYREMYAQTAWKIECIWVYKSRKSNQHTHTQTQISTCTNNFSTLTVARWLSLNYGYAHFYGWQSIRVCLQSFHWGKWVCFFFSFSLGMRSACVTNCWGSLSLFVCLCVSSFCSFPVSLLTLLKQHSVDWCCQWA